MVTDHHHQARNKEYLKNSVDYAQAVVVSAELIRNFPDWLKTCDHFFLMNVANRLTIDQQNRRAVRARREISKEWGEVSWPLGARCLGW